MKTFTVLLAACIATVALVASLAHAKQGDPIPNRDIVLEEDPGTSIVARGKADAKGSVNFGKLVPGRYVVAVPDLSEFKGPLVIAVSVNGAAPVLSEPLKPGKGKAYAMDRNGRKLMPAIDKPGGQIVVTIFEWQGK